MLQRPQSRALHAAPCTLLLIAPALGQESTAAQDTPGPELLRLDDTVVTATRFEHELFSLPRSVSVVDEVSLQRRNSLVALDALSERIGVWVEKRNGASSDPVIRGFSGGNILALVDGDSLTTFWGEGGYAGDDMYGKVDAESVERLEVIRGPSSVLYGSNALGGVINFTTRQAPGYTAGGWDFGGRFKTAFWGANNGAMLRGDVNGSNSNFRYRLGYTARDIGDTRGGGDLGLLEPSGIDESNFDLNTETRLSDSDYLEVNAQYVNRNGLSKYYKPTQRNNNDRQAAKLRWRSTDIGFGDEMSWSFYYQNKDDLRYWQDKPQEGVASWQTLASDFQTLTPLGDSHLLTWGLHANRDVGESPDDEQFTITNPSVGTQKAAPDSVWDNAALYLQDEWSLSEDWIVTGSARVDHFRYEADDNEFWTNPGSTGPENHAETAPGTHTDTALTGGLGLAHHLNSEWMAYGSWSRGYRLFAPGFGLRQTGYGVLAPTDGFLPPTTADQFELGTRVQHPWWSGTFAAYYSFLYDVQQPTPGSYNGQTHIDIDGDGNDERIHVTTGADGFVTGIEMDTAIDLGYFSSNLEGWSWHNGFMANYGEVDQDAGTEPLRHTHPARYLTSLRWQDQSSQSQPWAEFVGDFVAPFTRVSESKLSYDSDGNFTGDVGYLNDPQDKSSGLLDADGLPGYAVFHLRCGIYLAKGIELTVGVENLLDNKYRTAHSRMDAAGRNVIVGVTASF